MHMYVSYGHAMEHGHIIAFLVKMTFWAPNDPKWPQIDIWHHNIDRSQTDVHVWVTMVMLYNMNELNHF